MKGSIALRILYFFILATGQAALARISSTAKDEGEAMASSMENERDLASRITGGTTASKTRYPFFTYIAATLADDYTSDCGGSLIAKDVVLTAAHCLVDAVAIEVWVNVTSFDPSPYEYNRKASSWLMHPNYDDSTNANDIGLVFLRRAVDGVPLAKINRKKREPNAGKAVTAIGLGKIQSDPEIFPTDLMQVSMKILPDKECKFYGKDAFQGMNHICAGDNKNTCHGDSGGPLLLTGKERPSNDVKGPSNDVKRPGKDVKRPSKDDRRPSNDVVVGIMSYGAVPCGEFPSGFTRVSQFASWVTEHVCEKSVDPAPFKC